MTKELVSTPIFTQDGACLYNTCARCAIFLQHCSVSLQATCTATHDLQSVHTLLDVRDSLARVEVLWARLSAVHDRVTPVNAHNRGGSKRIRRAVSVGAGKRLVRVGITGAGSALEKQGTGGAGSREGGRKLNVVNTPVSPALATESRQLASFKPSTTVSMGQLLRTKREPHSGRLQHFKANEPSFSLGKCFRSVAGVRAINERSALN